jgi:hypothetical protein
MTFFPTPSAECIWTAASSGKSIGVTTGESKQAGFGLETQIQEASCSSSFSFFS